MASNPPADAPIATTVNKFNASLFLGGVDVFFVCISFVTAFLLVTFFVDFFF
ncbi:MAG: hypothetical protein ACOVO1_07300 [Chitinophagaceae bacterium]